MTESELSVRIGPADRNKMISCYAVNVELGETIVETHMVSVLCEYQEERGRHQRSLQKMGKRKKTDDKA